MTGKGDPSSYSPSEFINRTLPPTLIIQGEEDTIVLTRDAIAFRDAAQKAGANCTLHVYPRVGHLLTRNLQVQYKDFGLMCNQSASPVTLSPEIARFPAEEVCRPVVTAT